MRTRAGTLMIQGTASSVGKSLLVTALCRIFHQDGVPVAPFKSQNMALNSAVTPEGFEIGRAQAVQAEAAGIAPAVEMNPVLLKPEPGMRSQIVMMGRVFGTISWGEYHSHREETAKTIASALEALRSRYDLILIEGAGSPAEVNLRHQDLVNMHVARLAEAPVLLAGDIDRGGVFAQLVGTMDLLDADDRARVAGLIVNKFRGEPALFAPGVEFLERRCGVPVLGVVPFIERLRIADEDSVALQDRPRNPSRADLLDIAVIKLPSISNYDDFLSLEHEAGVSVRFADEAEGIEVADLVIIPGSKSTVHDLDWMRRHGFADAIAKRAAANRPIVGICGGCQMLGESIEDPGQVESRQATVEGLGLLGIITRFEALKRTTQVRAQSACESILTARTSAESLGGYEIHMGRVARREGTRAAFRIVARNGVEADELDGAVSVSGTIVGTMIHGIFENDSIRRSLLRALAERRGLAWSSTPDASAAREAEYDRLADAVRASLDIAAIRRIAKIG
jgi:adenosylcobyric acid synthase